MCCVELIANWVTIIGFPLALIGLCYTHKAFKQSIIAINQTKDIEEAKLWLQLRTDFYRYNNIHQQLLTNNEWVVGEDKSELYGYLGQFELCQDLLKKNLISREMFKVQYQYRVTIIQNNTSITNLLTKQQKNWKKLFELFKDFPPL